VSVAVAEAERIRELRLEARRINAKAKERARATGKRWKTMDHQDMEDFKRYCDIQIEIARIKSVASECRVG